MNGGEPVPPKLVPGERFPDLDLPDHTGRSRLLSEAAGGDPVADAYAHVCALTDPEAKLPFDTPEVQQVRRDAMAWWIPLLGGAFVCLTTLALDSVNYGGAITVARDPRYVADDPFARIFPGTVVRTSLFCEVPPPAGPAIERYRGVAWPGGRHPSIDDVA